MIEPYSLFYDTGEVIDGGGDDTDDEMVEVVIKVPRKFLHAPSDGLQFVIEREPDVCNYSDRHVHRTLRHGRDFFPYLLTGGFSVTDDIGPWLRSLGIIKFGRMMSELSYFELYQRVKNYKRIPMNSGRPRVKRPWIDEAHPTTTTD